MNKVGNDFRLEPKNILEFLGYVNDLKHTSRKGWGLCNIKNHEQVAGHMYGMAMMTFLLGDKSELDRFKCLQLALVHDLAESIVGDITPYDGISPEEKHKMEDAAMKKITCNLGDVGDLIYSLYKEYEEKSTPEAIFVKDLDLLDMIYSASYYEKRDGSSESLERFFKSADKIKNTDVKNIVEDIKKSRNLK